MITEGTEAFVLMHRSGRYLDWRLFIPTDSAGCHIPGEPSYYIYRLTPRITETWEGMSRNTLERFIERDGFDRQQFFIKPRPVCACCGDVDIVKNADGFYSPYRCAKHHHWNPCVIEGCTRMRSAIGTDGKIRLANNQVVCAEHWRRYVPPRSRERRLYHRHFRRAKRLGWNDDRIASFYAFWNRLVARVRARATEGHLDEAEINRLFGWTAED